MTNSALRSHAMVICRRITVPMESSTLKAATDTDFHKIETPLSVLNQYDVHFSKRLRDHPYYIRIVDNLAAVNLRGHCKSGFHSLPRVISMEMTLLISARKKMFQL